MRRALGLLLFAAATASAQGRVLVRAGKPNWSASGSTVTAAVVITNTADTALNVVTLVQLPQDWHVLTGTSPMVVDSGRVGLAMIGVSVPSRAAAGPYRIPVSVLVNQQVVGTDTIAVVVPERRAITAEVVD